MAGYLRQLAVREAGGNGNDAVIEPRTPGLHASWYSIAEDFDAPLPESFWLGAGNPAGETATA